LTTFPDQQSEDGRLFVAARASHVRDVLDHGDDPRADPCAEGATFAAGPLKEGDAP
jgi:hypothetical protein